jgi:diguanylate cyclase (GGDEF)-like protein
VGRAVEKLKRRLAKLEELANGSRKDPKVKAFEADLPIVVGEIFGPDSSEALNFRGFQISKFGAYNRGMSRLELDQLFEKWFREGASEKVALINALIARLEERKADLSDELGELARVEVDERGLLTKKAFISELPELVSSAIDNDVPLSLIMIDLDKFKPINDTHGHPAGDAVLQFIADALKRITGLKGRCYGFGGDEFSVVLPNHVADEAAAVAERIRREIEDSIIGDKKLRVTASLGVAEIPSHTVNAMDLLEFADDALYEAKRFGHNLVRVSGEPPPSPGKPRAATRRVPDFSGLSGDEVENIRKEWFRARFVVCPRDGSQLRVREFESDESVTPDLDVSCPLCGLSERIRAPR